MSTTFNNTVYLCDLLAFAPHPDDAEICCGGLLAKMARFGHKTAIVDMSRGELGTRGSIEQREKEASDAARVLNLYLRENLGFPDGHIGRDSKQMSVEEQTSLVVKTLRKLRPEIVLVPYWEERHPDHVAGSKLLTDALFLAGLAKFNSESSERYIPRQVIYYQMRFEFSPSFVIDISDDLETKYKAINCFGTQVAPHENSKSKDLPTLLTSALNLDSLKARDAYFGAMIGTRAGEAYLMRSPVQVGDPVSYFREFPGSENLIFPRLK